MGISANLKAGVGAQRLGEASGKMTGRKRGGNGGWIQPGEAEQTHRHYR